MNSTQIHLSIDPHKIAWLSFILESYEGLAFVRTEDPAIGRVVLHVGRGVESETASLLASLKEELGLIEDLSDAFPSSPAD